MRIKTFGAGSSSKWYCYLLYAGFYYRITYKHTEACITNVEIFYNTVFMNNCTETPEVLSGSKLGSNTEIWFKAPTVDSIRQ